MTGAQGEKRARDEEKGHIREGLVSELAPMKDLGKFMLDAS